MDIQKALVIPGWMTPGELNWLAEAASKSKWIVEIGCWRGRSSRAMVDNSSAVIFAVDTWDDKAIGYPGWWTDRESSNKYSKPDWLFKEYKDNLRDVSDRLQQFRMDSVSAARLMKQNMLTFDMIFIDADHTYEGVRQDIINWRPLLKPGGIFCGHDYGHPQCPDVIPAVHSLVKNVKVFETIWREECDTASSRGKNNEPQV
jgi:predicted O-methyltransferase YrrM